MARERKFGQRAEMASGWHAACPLGLLNATHLRRAPDRRLSARLRTLPLAGRKRFASSRRRRHNKETAMKLGRIFLVLAALVMGASLALPEAAQARHHHGGWYGNHYGGWYGYRPYRAYR